MKPMGENSKTFKQIGAFIKSERLRNGYATTSQMAKAQAALFSKNGIVSDTNTLRQRIRYIEEGSENCKISTLLSVLDFLGYSITIRTKNSSLLPAALAPIRHVKGFDRYAKIRIPVPQQDEPKNNKAISEPNEQPVCPVERAGQQKEPAKPITPLNDLWSIMSRQGFGIKSE